jgi:hypothetical protein
MSGAGRYSCSVGHYRASGGLLLGERWPLLAHGGPLLGQRGSFAFASHRLGMTGTRGCFGSG